MDGQQFITIVTGGNRIQGSAVGDAVWTFALNGNVQPLWPPSPPVQVAGPLGPIAHGVNKVRIGDNNTEYSYLPSRTRVKQGTQVTFTTVGDLPHTASATAGMEGKWDTGALARGSERQSPSINSAATITSARRTRGCMVRLSSSHNMVWSGACGSPAAAGSSDANSCSPQPLVSGQGSNLGSAD